MNRKRDELIPLELQLLSTGLELQVRGVEEFHGFAIAKELADQTGAKALTAHGTLYKALTRLTQRKFLESRWERGEEAIKEGRPRRRLYRVTSAGAAEVARRMRAEHPQEGKLSPATSRGIAVPLGRGLLGGKGRV